MHYPSLAIRPVCTVAALALSAACTLVEDPDDAENIPYLGASSPPTVDALIVTQLSVLDERFSLERVMNRLVELSGDPQATGASLYYQLWNTNRHCSSQLNGFPLQCPRQEAILSVSDPFDANRADNYVPIALVNRFDLAPADGSNCGEYRIIYGKISPFTFLFDLLDRNLIIFEPVLPNPRPEEGLEGCRPVAELWDRVAHTDDPGERAEMLATLYFDGLDGFEPVIHPDHLGSVEGQIRSNQFMFFRPYFNGLPLFQLWQLREYELVTEIGDDGQPRLSAIQVPDKNNPFAGLFNDRSTPSGPGPSFRQDFLTQVAGLASATDVNDLHLNVPDVYNQGESVEQFFESDLVFHFVFGTGAFAAQIQHELDRIGSPLTPTHIVRRAMTTTCAGCHQLSTRFGGGNHDLGGGLAFPDSNVFTHVSERDIVPCETSSGSCFQISAALRDSFLPRRLEILASFLEATP